MAEKTNTENTFEINIYVNIEFFVKKKKKIKSK